MEDAHATILDLQAKFGEGGGKPTDPSKRLSFFGVYDGHGGDKVALFAGDNVHKIVAKQEAFKKGDIEQALKDGFLATDRAILEGWLQSVSPGLLAGWARAFDGTWLITRVDPKYEEEVSGCTASVGVISRDKIWVVCICCYTKVSLSYMVYRPMLVIHDLCLVSRVAQSLCPLITNPRTKVRIPLVSILPVPI